MSEGFISIYLFVYFYIIPIFYDHGVWGGLFWVGVRAGWGLGGGVGSLELYTWIAGSNTAIMGFIIVEQQCRTRGISYLHC